MGHHSGGGVVGDDGGLRSQHWRSIGASTAAGAVAAEQHNPRMQLRKWLAFWRIPKVKFMLHFFSAVLHILLLTLLIVYPHAYTFDARRSRARRSRRASASSRECSPRRAGRTRRNTAATRANNSRGENGLVR